VLNNGAGNGEGILKRWHVYVALLSILLAAGKIVFTAGDTGARTEEQMREFRQRLDKDEQELARKDVLDPRLSSIEQSQKETKAALEQENAKLDKIMEMELQIRARK